MFRSNTNPESISTKPTKLSARFLGRRAVASAQSAEQASPDFKARYQRQEIPIDTIRTVDTVDARTKIERPRDSYIAELQKDDSRIQVIHIGQGGNIADAIADRLDKDFAGEDMVTIRSIETSLNGVVEDSELEVHDIRDTLRLGDIRMRKFVNVGGYSIGAPDEGHGRLHYRVLQYATQTATFRSYALDDKEGSDAVFPAVLVYDETKFVDHTDANGGAFQRGHYGQGLPDSAQDRQALIRAAYILDTEIRQYP